MVVPGKNRGGLWVSEGNIFQQNDFQCFGAKRQSLVAEGSTQWGLCGGEVVSPPHWAVL